MYTRYTTYQWPLGWLGVFVWYGRMTPCDLNVNIIIAALARPDGNYILGTPTAVGFGWSGIL
jgi:hypothetical protein